MKENLERKTEITNIHLIVLSSDDETLPSSKERVWNKIKNVAEKRGFIFSEQLTAEAYGEYLNACVASVAENMSGVSGINKPIKIRTDLTDFKLENIADPKKAEQHKKKKISIKDTEIDFSEPPKEPPGNPEN